MPVSPEGHTQGSALSAYRQVVPLCLLAGLAIVYSWLIGHSPAIASLHSSLMNGIQFPLTQSGPLSDKADVLHSASLCLFKSWAHLPCLFCGLTRSFICIGQGHWLESWQYHPMGFLVYGLASLFSALGLLKPVWAYKALGLLSTRKSLGLALLLFSACWLWKLGQNPRFW